MRQKGSKHDATLARTRKAATFGQDERNALLKRNNYPRPPDLVVESDIVRTLALCASRAWRGELWISVIQAAATCSSITRQWHASRVECLISRQQDDQTGEILG